MKTLDALKAKAAEAKQGGGEKKQFLSLKAGEQFKIRFRQELSEDAKNYSEELGTAKIVPVHVHPQKFQKKLACTLEDAEFDNRCWAHEQISSNPKWREKPNFIANVAVLDNNEWSNRLLNQSFSTKHVVNSLIEYAVEFGSITNRDFKITRIGSGMNDTQYTLIPLDPKEAGEDVTSLEVYDLSKIFRKLDYDDQEKFFTEDEEETKSSAKSW